MPLPRRQGADQPLQIEAQRLRRGDGGAGHPFEVARIDALQLAPMPGTHALLTQVLKSAHQPCFRLLDLIPTGDQRHQGILPEVFGLLRGKMVLGAHRSQAGAEPLEQGLDARR